MESGSSVQLSNSCVGSDNGLSFDTSDIESMLWLSRRPSPNSAWHGHVAFAHWLVHVARPLSIVELGTENGVSYGAFCHASAAIGMATKCYAIDTWEGDQHAGFYSDEIFHEVSTFNEPYKAFSTLMRTTFDQARPNFRDGSIDLLHIDGLHTYEAVKHDFETWFATLSPRGVVLFHDTAIQERGFGVWKFWAEVSNHFPSFCFDHSAGLGMLLVGAEQPKQLESLCRLSDDREVLRVKNNFIHFSDWARLAAMR